MTEGGAPVEVVWTWTSLLQVAFTTGLCTATFNQVLAWTKESFQRRQKDRVDGRTLALQLVELLTAYAQECNSRIDANLYDDRTGGYARYSEMPILKPFPEGERGVSCPPNWPRELGICATRLTKQPEKLWACLKWMGHRMRPMLRPAATAQLDIPRCVWPRVSGDTIGWVTIKPQASPHSKSNSGKDTELAIRVR
jgi:hypothetical protein